MQESETQIQQPVELTEAEHLALRAFQETRCEHAPTWVLGGILGGLLTSVIINIQAGFFVTIMTAGVAFTNTINQGNKRLRLLKGEQPITSVMSADLLEDYKEVVGEEIFEQQIEQLSDGNFNLSKDVQKLAHTKKLVKNSQDISPDEELAICYSQCCLILASPGAGKDFLVSNAIRRARIQNPALKIYVIDPKGLPHERNYYEGFVDIFDSRQCASMQDGDIAQWVKNNIENFQELNTNVKENWLFVITEATLVGGAFSRLNDDYLAGFTSKFTVTANGFGNALWMLAQFPNLKDLGISNNGRSQLQVFAIVTKETVNKVRQWVRSGVIPKCKESDLKIMCERSDVNRAFYSPVALKWGIMPELKNYSGYDRDNRKFTAVSVQEPTDNHQASNQSINPKTSTKTRRVDPVQNKWDEVFQKLMEVPTNNLEEAIQLVEPTSVETVSEIAHAIQCNAIRNERMDVLNKFGL